MYLGPGITPSDRTIRNNKAYHSSSGSLSNWVAVAVGTHSNDSMIPTQNRTKGILSTNHPPDHHHHPPLLVILAVLLLLALLFLVEEEGEIRLLLLAWIHNHKHRQIPWQVVEQEKWLHFMVQFVSRFVPLLLPQIQLLLLAQPPETEKISMLTLTIF